MTEEKTKIENINNLYVWNGMIHGEDYNIYVLSTDIELAKETAISKAPHSIQAVVGEIIKNQPRILNTGDSFIIKRGSHLA